MTSNLWTISDINAAWSLSDTRRHIRALLPLLKRLIVRMEGVSDGVKVEMHDLQRAGTVHVQYGTEGFFCECSSGFSGVCDHALLVFHGLLRERKSKSKSSRSAPTCL